MSEETGFEIHLSACHEEALERVIAALKAQGFGVLTQINVQATLKEKLGKDFRPYVILGACNPPLAHRALETDPVVGLMLPCNVTVEADENDGAIIRIANPEIMMQAGSLQTNDELKSVAREARMRLEQVAKTLLEA